MRVAAFIGIPIYIFRKDNNTKIVCVVLISFVSFLYSFPIITCGRPLLIAFCDAVVSFRLDLEEVVYILFSCQISCRCSIFHFYLGRSSVSDVISVLYSDWLNISSASHLITLLESLPVSST